MKVSAWKTALIDIDRATEFTGDDVDRYSKLVDLKENYEFLTVRLPALSASAIISVYVQEGEAVSERTSGVIIESMDNHRHFAYRFPFLDINRNDSTSRQSW